MSIDHGRIPIPNAPSARFAARDNDTITYRNVRRTKTAGWNPPSGSARHARFPPFVPMTIFTRPSGLSVSVNS